MQSDDPWTRLTAYSGSYKVLDRIMKTLLIAMNGRQVTVSNDSVNPAYMMMDSDDRTVNT